MIIILSQSLGCPVVHCILYHPDLANLWSLLASLRKAVLKLESDSSSFAVSLEILMGKSFRWGMILKNKTQKTVFSHDMISKCYVFNRTFYHSWRERKKGMKIHQKRIKSSQKLNITELHIQYQSNARRDAEGEKRRNRRVFGWRLLKWMILLKENVSVKPVTMHNEYIAKYSLEAFSRSSCVLSEMLPP